MSMKRIGLLLLAITVMSATCLGAVPVLTSLDLEETTLYGPLGGSLVAGYEMHLDGHDHVAGLPPGWVDYRHDADYQIDILGATTNVDLRPGQYGFFLTGSPADLFAYWDAKGVHAGAAPLSWQEFMWWIINGLAPMVYIEVDALQNFTLLDGLQWGFFGVRQPMAVPGDYPGGTYDLVGRIQSDDGDWSVPITLDVTLLSGDPETDVRDASAYLDPTGAGELRMNPGDTVVLQRFKIEDPGTFNPPANDVEPDGFDTHIKTIAVRVDPLIPAGDRAQVERLWLYQDNGDLQFNALTDTPLWIPLNGFDAGWQAVFGAPIGQQASAFLVVPDNSIRWFFLVAKMRTCCYNLDEVLRTEVFAVETSNPAGLASSRIEVIDGMSEATYRFETGPGTCDADLLDLALAPPLPPVIVPGQDDEVLQRLRLTDNGVDGNVTALRSMVFQRRAGTLDTANLRDFRLWRDVNGNGIVDAGDVPLGYVAAGDLTAGVTFSALPNALLVVANGANAELIFAAFVEPSAPAGATLQVEVTAQTGDGLGDPNVGGVLGASSRICTAMPVDATDTVEVAGAAPANQDPETNVSDETVGRTILPGSVGVVVQEVTLYDADDPDVAGAGDVDENPDGFPTRIDTVQIGLVGLPAVNELLDNGCVARLGLYQETDGLLGYTPGDLLLDEALNPTSADFTAPNVFEFGTDGVLLVAVPDDDDITLYLVGDFVCNTCICGDDLQTTFTAHAFFDGVNHSSDFDAGQAFPVNAGGAVVLARTADDEADLTDLTAARYVQPGDTGIVIQEFVIEDPGVRGDTLDDGLGAIIDEIVVRLHAASTILPDEIVALRLYQENDGTAGFTGGDALRATQVAPVLDGRSTFVGAPIFPAVTDVGRFYLVADLAALGPVDGDFLRSTVLLIPDCAGSGIEDLQPLVAGNPVTVGIAPVGVIVEVLDALVFPTGAGIVDVTTTATNMADFQIGTQTGSTNVLGITNSDKLDVTGVIGVHPYVVDSFNVVDNNDGTNVEVTFTARLKPGQLPSAGVFAKLEVTGTGAHGDTCNAVISGLDVFRDPGAVDIAPFTLVAGVITLSNAAPPPGGGTSGDVNLDGAVDITDARWAAEFALGMRPLTAQQKANADVAPPHMPPDSNIDITDARWIAEAAIGLRTLSVSVAKPQGQLATASIEVSAFAELVISGSSTELADVQATLYYDPDEIRITGVEGVNGFEVLASWIDGKAGWIKFAAAKLSGGSISDGPIVMFKTNDDLSSATLSLDVLRNASGQDIPFDVLNVGLAGQILEFGCSPNPVQDVHTTYFSVKATSAVDQIRIYIYDFSGQLMYDSGWGPNDLAWHLENDAGDVLANGVYYYRMEVLFVGADKPVVTGIGRVAVYR